MYDGYKGRGLIQITYRRNYMAYGSMAHHDFLGAHRQDLEQPAWATDSAGWFWTTGSGKDLNILADNDDLLAITARINGGFNGFEDRRERLMTAKSVLEVSCCPLARMAPSGFLPFKDSDIYNNRVQAFAWGCWNDYKTQKRGVVKSADDRKQGYSRYLELVKTMLQARRRERPHFGFSPQKMHDLAMEGCK